MNGAAGPGDDRRINHFAVERNDAGTLLLSFFNDDKNALGPGDFFRGRRKCLVDHADLARIDGKLSLEAEGTGVLSVEKEPFGIVGIGEGGIDGVDAGCRCSVGEHAAGKDEFAAFARALSAQRCGVVLAAEREERHAFARQGNFETPGEPHRRFNERHDEGLLRCAAGRFSLFEQCFAGTDVVDRFGLGEHDCIRAAGHDSSNVRFAAGRERVDAHGAFYARVINAL